MRHASTVFGELPRTRESRWCSQPRATRQKSGSSGLVFIGLAVFMVPPFPGTTRSASATISAYPSMKSGPACT